MDSAGLDALPPDERTRSPLSSSGHFSINVYNLLSPSISYHRRGSIASRHPYCMPSDGTTQDCFESRAPRQFMSGSLHFHSSSFPQSVCHIDSREIWVASEKKIQIIHVNLKACRPSTFPSHKSGFEHGLTHHPYDYSRQAAHHMNASRNWGANESLCQSIRCETGPLAIRSTENEHIDIA